MNKSKLFTLFLLLFCFAFGSFAFAEIEKQDLPKLLIFFSPSCHKCQEAKAKVLPNIEKEFGKRLTFEYRDMSNEENYRLLLSLKEKFEPKLEIKIPVFYLNGNLINSEGNLPEKLRNFILISLEKHNAGTFLNRINLLEYFKRIAPLAVIIAGLQDGINPCAFTVIVFFISFLALQGYRKRELFLIGISFIFSVFLTYILIGFGIFNFLYSIRNFWVITRSINFVVGTLSIVLGVFALYDYFKFRSSKETSGLILQLPQQIKNRIHSLIGFYYRKGRSQEVPVVKPKLLKLVASALVTGFLVSLLEAVCTGQVYLPTMAFIFKTTSLKLHALGYILLYNIMFIVPLIAIFLLSLFGFTSGDFSRFMKRHLGLIKILMALLFFSLGILLIGGN